MKSGALAEIRAAGGEVYAITSEPQYLADQAHEHWELEFENVGDPHQEISRTCSERGWLTLYANRGDHTFLQRGADWQVEHPKGYFQPGVLALTRERRILYRWRSIPSDANLQGTVARPTATHAWGAIKSALEAGDAAGDAALDDDPEVDQRPPPRPLFIAALLANGWFVGVKSFAYSPGVADTPKRFAKAFSRWILFAVVWVGLLVVLPTALVAAGFAAWAVWVARDIRRTMGRLNVQVELAPDR